MDRHLVAEPGRWRSQITSPAHLAAEDGDRIQAQTIEFKALWWGRRSFTRVEGDGGPIRRACPDHSHHGRDQIEGLFGCLQGGIGADVSLVGAVYEDRIAVAVDAEGVDACICCLGNRKREDILSRRCAFRNLQLVAHGPKLHNQPVYVGEEEIEPPRLAGSVLHMHSTSLERPVQRAALLLGRNHDGGDLVRFTGITYYAHRAHHGGDLLVLPHSDNVLPRALKKDAQFCILFATGD